MRMTCTSCGGRIFGRANCVICDKEFMLRHPKQITCARVRCRKTRQLQKQATWIAKLRGFSGKFITCRICEKRVPRVRGNQATCLAKRCVAKT